MAVTLKDVAERAGVSIATASYALRGRAIVKPATRLKVEAAAKQLGYRKDATASLLASRPFSQKSEPGKLTLAWLKAPRAITHMDESFVKEAERYGYNSEMFDLRDFSSPEAAIRYLYFRNVVGAFLASPGAFPDGRYSRADWSRFALVKYTRAWPEFSVPLIRHSAFDYMHLAIRNVVAQGYSRIGVILGTSKVHVDDDARLGAALGFHGLRCRETVVIDWWKEQLDLSYPDAWNSDGLRRWIDDFQPDAVVAFPYSACFLIQDAGYSLPQDFALAGVLVPDGETYFSGCLAQYAILSLRAVEILHQSLLIGRRGFCANPEESVVEPLWNAGQTLPRKASSPA